MIRSITIENFCSIYKKQEINFLVGDNVPDDPELFSRSDFDRTIRTPKVVAFFGANASGKTSVLKAFAFLKWLVADSFIAPPDVSIPSYPFATNNGVTSPTRITIDFDSYIIGEEMQRYSYSVELKNSKPENKKNTASVIKTEILLESIYWWPSGSRKRLLVRDRNGIQDSKEFRIRKRDFPTSNLRTNASFLATLAQYSHPVALKIKEVVDSIQTNINVLVGKVEYDYSEIATYYLNNREILEQLNRTIKVMDFGLQNVDVSRDNANEIITTFAHKGLDVPLLWHLESSGTRKFVSLFPQLNYVLHTGGLAVIDEIDNDIHPLLLPEILSWFKNEKNNPYNAQLFISCHNATLLESLNKEEVFFVEKDNQGQTSVYGLQDIKGVRRDENIYRKYIGGVYGGIPQIG